MDCPIEREKDGEIKEVYATNGEKSLAYRSILDSLERNTDEAYLGKLQDIYRPWVGKHIRSVEDKKELALGMYKHLDSPNFKKWFGASKHVDANGEPLIRDGKIENDQGEFKSALNRGTFSKFTEDPYWQKPANQVPASPATMKAVNEFLSRIDVDVKELKEIAGANGIASPLHGLIQVAEGKRDIALPEEAMHMAVALVKQKNLSLYKEMMDRIGNYRVMDDTMRLYKNDKNYKLPDGKPNIPKLKEEAIGKLLADTLNGTNEEKENVPRKWWQKILDFLKSLFLKAKFNPFEKLATDIKEGKENLGSIHDITEDSGEFLQKNDEIEKSLVDNNNHISINRETDKFMVDNEPVRSVMDKVQESIKTNYPKAEVSEEKKAWADFKKEKSEAILTNLKNEIFKRRIGDDHLPKENPGILGIKGTIYTTLDNWAEQKINTYEKGTKFFIDTNIYDGKTAGNVDFMALKPNGKVDLLQFKFPEIYKGNYIKYQRLYDVEIGGLMKILQSTKYGIKKDNFSQTRAIPIKVDYKSTGSKSYISGLKIGNVDVKAIQDDELLPFPSFSEKTGTKQLDDILSRLWGLYTTMSAEKVPPSQRDIKSDRLKKLYTSIRKLQIQKDIKNVLDAGESLISAMEARGEDLKKQVEDFQVNPEDPSELNTLSKRLLTYIEEVGIYSDMYEVANKLLDKKVPEEMETLNKAGALSLRANSTIEDYIDLGGKLMQKPFEEEFPGWGNMMTPEKELGYMKKMFSTQSRLPLKNTALLWSMAERINHLTQFRWNDARKELADIQNSIVRGVGIDKATEMLLQKDSEGKYTGKFSQKYDPRFYKQLNIVLGKGGKEAADWIKNNINTEAYNKWYENNLQELTQILKDRGETEDYINEQLKNAESRHSIKEGNADPSNWKLKEFPKEGKWESEEYKEIKNYPEVKALYDWWTEEQQYSHKIGMLESTHGLSYWPSVEKSQLRRLFTGEGLDITKGIRVPTINPVEEINPRTGEPIKVLHAPFTKDNLSLGERSFNLFRVMGLHTFERIRYELRSEIESAANLVAMLESYKDVFKTNFSGKKRRNKEGIILNPVENTENLALVKEIRDLLVYGQTQAQSGAIIEFPLRKFALAVNKLAGRTIIEVPEEYISYISLEKLGRAAMAYFRLNVIGLNPTVPIAHIFGGTINMFVGANGRYLDKGSILKAQMELASGKFDSSEESMKRMALLAWLHPGLTSSKDKEISKLSVTGLSKHLAGEDAFSMIMGADNLISMVATTAMIDNAAVVDGKIVNIRQYVTGKYKDQYQYGARKAIEFQKQIEKEIQEMKDSPQALVNYAQIIDDKLVIPGIDLHSKTFQDLRQLSQEFIKNVLGTVTEDDRAAYHNSFLLSALAQFKGWIFRLFEVHFQGFGYRPSSRTVEMGRFRMLWHYMMERGLKSISDGIKMLVNSNPTDSIIDAAKKLHQQHEQEASEEEEDMPPISEEEFIRDYFNGVRKQFKEIAATLALVSLMILMKLESPGKDEDDTTKGEYKWLLKAITKAEERITVFYDPQAYTDMANGSIFSAMSMLVDMEKLLNKGVRKTYYNMIGDNTEADRIHLAPNVFRLFPILRQASSPIAIFDPEYAKAHGFAVSSATGQSK